MMSRLKQSKTAKDLETGITTGLIGKGSFLKIYVM